MIEKPKLKTFLTVFPIAADTWGLRGGFEEHWKLKLRDERAMRAFSSILPYLNGQHTTDEITNRVGENGIEQEAVRQLLEHMEASSLIEDAGSIDISPNEEEQFRDQISFFSRFSSEGGGKYQSRLLSSHIGLVGDGNLSRSVLRHLDIAGFGGVTILNDTPPDVHGIAGDNESSDGRRRSKLTTLMLDRQSIWTGDVPEELPEAFIVPQESHDPQLLESMDAFSKANNVPWMLLRAVDPHEGWVGPLFIPGDTASYLSLEARLRGNIQHFDEYQEFDRHLRSQRTPGAPCGGLHTFFDLLSSIAVTEMIKFIGDLGVPHLAGRFMSLNVLTWDTEVHEVLRVPHLEKESQQPRIFPWRDIPYGDKKTRRA